MTGSEKVPQYRPPIRRLAIVEDQSCVQEIMTKNAYCASLDTNIAPLIEVFLERCIGGAPVVDSEGRPIGMISKSDLVRVAWQNAASTRDSGDKFHAQKSITARDLMAPVVFCLPDSASVSQAAALMAFEEVHQIPIVDDTGRMAGMVTTLDIMRWIARREGYLIP
jgi:CBS domain-containing protein